MIKIITICTIIVCTASVLRLCMIVCVFVLCVVLCAVLCTILYVLHIVVLFLCVCGLCENCVSSVCGLCAGVYVFCFVCAYICVQVYDCVCVISVYVCVRMCVRGSVEVMSNSIRYPPCWYPMRV